MARIRTLNFLPDIFQTPSNAEFFGATLDQLVNPPSITKIQGYVGSRFGTGVNAKDYYVVEPTKTRVDYQLDPGVVFTKPNESVAKDFISYPGILDSIAMQGGIVDNNSRLFTSQFYSWDSFTDLDKTINFNQYYWLPEGPPAVTVAAASVFSKENYTVTDLPNGYSIAAGAGAGTINPTLTLLRGGTYTFSVSQTSQFWIQGAPGVSGYSPLQPNQPVRDVFGVSNNGASTGIVTFAVPSKTAQDEYAFPGNNVVDVVSTTPFDQVNGMPVTSTTNIDGVTALEGLRVMFYNTGVVNEIGYISSYFGETSFDTNNDLIVAPITLTVGSSSTTAFSLSSGTTALLNVGNTITFDNPVFGGITGGQVYYINEIVNSTDFKISLTLGGTNIALTSGSGTMTVNINQGLYEEGFYTTVAQNFYRVTYVGDPDSPVIRLVPDGLIPSEQRITPTYGNTWHNLPFYRNTLGVINLIPYITAPLDVLYYQDGTSSNKIGIIRLIENNLNNTINVETQILGKTNYTSTTGVAFTNGLKVKFDGDVIPSSYLTGEYYVEGVGTAIELVPVIDLVSPEKFTINQYILYDLLKYDIENFDSTLNIPVTPDYITIARNSISKNAWSRSNRWFHIDVINATATYNNDPTITTKYATGTNKAVRPIVEFYPNLKLWDSGIIGKNPVDFIDYRTTDALSTVSGSLNYYPDVQVYSTNTATITASSVIPIAASAMVPGTTYKITEVGTTNWNTVAGTIDQYYYVGQSVLCAVAGTGTGKGLPLTTSTTITVPASAVTGSLVNYMFIADSLNLLPPNSQITNISGTTTLTLTISWETPQQIVGGTSVSIVASDTTVNNYGLFPGARVVFAADTEVSIRNKIYVANFSSITPFSAPVITLTLAEDGVCLPDSQIVVTRGFTNQGLSFHFDGLNWNASQQKTNLNQAPLFDIFDENGISLGDTDIYQSTSFAGCKLFAYGYGSGTEDTVLGFPIRYSSFDNVGDISFDISFNLDTFDYVRNGAPINSKVNIGYVYNYTSATTNIRQLGWQTAIAPSIQYQNFSFNYVASAPNATFACNIAALANLATGEKGWPRVQVYINNVYQNSDTYKVDIGTNTTIITLLGDLPTVDTVVQIQVLSDQVSNVAYYSVPNNLNNNPFNADLTTANIGDIRAQYKDIFINAPNTTGSIFGANNYRDCGDLVPYGTKIIQNSASLAIPGAFLRNQEHNLFDALLFNSREYVKFKQLLVDTVQNSDYVQRYAPSQILDDALDQITAAKSQINAFFWSDMLPSKSPYIGNTYIFNNALENTFYPLSKIYNFSSANYDGVLVYLSRTVDNVLVQKQLTVNVDYVISADSPSLEIILPMQAGDQITIKEYNQTYGSYVPNTPTKLGVYPAFEPTVVLDSDYMVPTYFIKGHDGSFNKLYGDYNETLGVLIDFRDQALLEFELRVYNNLKLSAKVPIARYEVVPGYFRNPTYSWDNFLDIYSTSFLNWIGQNHLDYKTQYFTKNNEFSYNYTNSANKLDQTPIKQGYWRGVYEYFYDTTTPNETPWEMLAFANMPTWWTARYGPAPYTSDNGVLWGDLELGLIWNNGNPYIQPELARPGLSNIIPVDSTGALLSPLISIVGNYNPSTFNKDWVVGDDAPTELSYRRSSTYPFDLTRIFALTRPAEFFNLAVDLDNYKYNAEFNQYLVNDRSHLVPSNIEIYGNGTAKTSYINWIVDYEKQQGVDATTNITTLLNNLDVRLVYRLAGYSDKTLLKFYVEKASPNSRNASLLIPDESYSVLLYENQPFDQLMFSGVVIQQNKDYWTVFGNSQNVAYFETLDPRYNGQTETLTVENKTVKLAKDYGTTVTLVPYGTKFYSTQDVAQFLVSYGKNLESKGMMFDEIQNGVPITWAQMVNEFLYWTQTGWEDGSIITVNPAATKMQINPPSAIVQPLTIQQQNFILNQNLYPINLKDLCVNRDGTLFSAHTLSDGDAMSYAQFNISNFEHGIVFDNVTMFNDVIYNLTTGLRQNRISVRGTKTAEWNGTVNAYGFILNQDNVKEWNGNLKYTKGVIVKYKNKYWTALKVIEPTIKFNDQDWKEVDYANIQKGLLSNPSTRAYESVLYYDVNQANLEQDADLLSFSLIGYRPRDYLALVDLTDTAQVQVYKNLIKNKGTRNSINAFKGANLPQGGIQYDAYENWSIKTGKFGGVLNENFVEFKVNQEYMTGNPSIVSLTEGTYTVGSMQEVPLYSLFNYGSTIDSPNILSTTNAEPHTYLYPSAGYVNFNDVKMSSYFYSGLPFAVDGNGITVPIQSFYVGEYMWLANFKERWEVYRWKPVGQVVQVRNNLNATATVTFSTPHGLSKYDPMSIINFADNINGYYIVTEIVSLTEILINLTANVSGTSAIQGRGIGMKFESQRVATPADIAALDLTENEFIKNTVWVDTNNDGNWAVYRKSINYLYQTELEKSGTTTLGSAVAYTPQMGYLVSDAAAGKLYRYAYDALTETYALAETKTGSTSFGSTIVYAQASNIYVVSEPTSGSPKVYIYVLNNTVVSDDIVTYQTPIAAPGGVTNWGSKLALSDDARWLYVSDSANNKVYVYRQDRIKLNAGYFVVGQTYIITSVGTTDFTAIGAIDNQIGITFVATGVGTGNGTATQITYRQSTIIDGASYGLTLGDGFGKAIATGSDSSVLVVGAPEVDYSATITDWGKAYAFTRTVQNFNVQSSSLPNQPQTYKLGWTPTAGTARTASATSASTNRITCSGSMTGFAVNDPVVFAGATFGDSNVSPTQVYYIHGISGSEISIKLSRSSTTAVQLKNASSLSFSVYVQVDPLYVQINGIMVDDNNYGVIGSNFVYYGTTFAGDIINVSDNQFYLTQTFNSKYTDRVGAHFGYAIDCTSRCTDILIGSPFEIDTADQEGAAYRFTNGGARYGLVVGAAVCNITAPTQVLINGYLTYLPIGNATVIAKAINQSQIINVQATATADNKLIIQLIDTTLAQVNDKLVITAFDTTTLTQLGIQVYTNTQIIKCPHTQGPSQFGTNIKYNEFDSVLISAPAGTRYEGTVFDFTDDENFDNDTVFDNNATRFVESYPNAGAVYMFDYLEEYNESVITSGAYVYAQSVNNTSTDYGYNPNYGAALEFNDNIVVVGAPDYLPASVGGQVTVYNNATGITDWAIFRQSAAVVDIEKIQNTQLFSATTNNTLINFDYIDPLQGKILGAARENLDFVTSVDPAKYNSDVNAPTNYIWGADHVGMLWFNTANTRFVNYHQNDVVYNSKHWGQLFPGSDVAVYSWIASFIPPVNYQGPGVPLDINKFCVNAVLNSSDVLSPIYYFWVRNTNVIFTQTGKTLSDNVVASYIANPAASGIAYMAPLLPNTFAMYNAGDYFNANDTVFHIGYANGTTDDVSHQEFALIREDYADDFLPGIPGITDTLTYASIDGKTTYSKYGHPEGLYAKLLDSLSGADGAGQVVPNPYLPFAVQSGVLARPRQSLFYNRFMALDNYLSYANTILAQYPITELREELSFLFTSGEFFNTPDYWEYVNWWATGYDNNTKSSSQVPIYADLSSLNVVINTIVTVMQNGAGKAEVYRYDGNGVWTRIGLAQGTIAFKNTLWDYSAGKLGFSGNFFDTSPFDEYPSEETRNIIRALNEQIYIQDLLIYRNKSLILLFEYIQSETAESQNFLPWLNKTSLVDVAHTIRELKPYEVFKTDNQEFLAGYINEVKPYHVVIKDFLFKYTGAEVFEGDITDFDLPATYNSAYQEFITPELVYGVPENQYEFALSDNIWSTAPYSQWFANYGVSIEGQENYNITTLTSYLNRSSKYILVDNAQGFPINGVMMIGTEQIGYSLVDRALNKISGLIRGVNGTAVVDHIPGTPIIMDLPAVLLLSGGRGYSNPPRVTAYIDTGKYPEPTVPAEFEAVMNLDSVLSVNLVNPGQGYAVLPEIIIEPAEQIYFDTTAVNSSLHTITMYAPNLRTGDMLQYKVITGTSVGLLADNQWYYINVLEDTPTAIVALYKNYSNAINDHDRIMLYYQGIGNVSLNLGARASAVTSAKPIRENSISIKFDRTTYTSQVVDWKTGAFYGSFFAGNYSVATTSSSSSLLLESTQPDINTVLASAQGTLFEIAKVNNDRNLTWSSFVRSVYSTVGGTDDIVRLRPLDGIGNPFSYEVNASGTTIGFYVGMPIKFAGAVAGGIIENQIYYVHNIVNGTDFQLTLNEDGSGPAVNLTTATINAAGLGCYTGQVTDTAVLTVNYPGILQVTNTAKTTNYLTVPMSLIGTGGTRGFYTNLPIFFTGKVFGNIVENETYYITTVVDNETFTMSLHTDPVTTMVTATTTSTNIITVDSTDGFTINDPIIFNTMVISGSSVATFGNIVSGTTYYVSQIISPTQMTISTIVNGAVFTLANATGTAVVTNQKDVLQLTTASGSMTMNVSLPVSPGQVDGQLFTLYSSSVQYPNISSGIIANLLERQVTASITSVNRLAISELSGGTDLFYTNMPFQLSTSTGGIPASTTYYVVDYSGMPIPDVDHPGEYIPLPNIQTLVSFASSTGNLLTCDSTASLYAGMPIVFSGISLGGIEIGVTYFVRTIPSGTTFTISAIKNGSTFVLTNQGGIMLGTGEPYITVTNILGNPAVALSNGIGTTLTQHVTGTPSFDLSYMAGGYSAIISSAGSGFAINNTIAIAGTAVGGTSPTNDVTLTVSAISSTGAITHVIPAGTVPGTDAQYYLKVRSPNTFGVYSNALMTVPVSGIDFGYVGFTSAKITNINSSNNRLTVADTSIFAVNDAVVFTGTVQTSLTNIIAGETYYIYDIPNATQFRICTNPGDVGTIVTMVTTIAVDFTMTTPGSYAFLAEPFYFNQSIVRFNNRIYVCVVSNNDDTFVLGKWEQLDSGDRRMNAMDRTIGYYQPTINMPGLDLTQLFEGVTYPNSTYKGNAFEPSQQFTLDTILQDRPFYPTQVNTVASAYKEGIYYAVANLPDYTGILKSNDGIIWDITKLTSSNLNATSIFNTSAFYLIGTTNTATPIFRSEYNLDPTWSALTVAPSTVQAFGYNGASWIAVGSSIMRSTNTIDWNTVYTYNPTYDIELYGVTNVNSASFTGYVAVGSGLRPDYTTGVTELVPTNIISYSTTGEYWNDVASLTPKGMYSVAVEQSTGKLIAVGQSGIVYTSLNGASWLGITEVTVTSVNAATDTLNVTNTSGLVLNQTVRFSASFSSIVAGTTYYVKTIVSATQVELSATSGGTLFDLTTGSPVAQTMMNVYDDTDPTPATLRSVINPDGVWVAVGDSGTIKTSTDGNVWTAGLSGTTENLNSVTYADGTYIVTGDNDTILTSNSLTLGGVISAIQYDTITGFNGQSNLVITAGNGANDARCSVSGGVISITTPGTGYPVGQTIAYLGSGGTRIVITVSNWINSSVFVDAPAIYTVKGADFSYGYGPEELVPGVITDNLAMTVITSPGTNWPITEYSHSGYNVASVELSPTSGTQTVYSFNNVLQYPIQIAVQVLDSTDYCGTTLPATAYTVNWINKTITLATPLAFSPAMQKLRIDVYEVGNGNQIVKSNTDTDPIRISVTGSGFNDIYLSCNYSATITEGSGVIRPETFDVTITALETYSGTDRILCDDTGKLSLNIPVTFSGAVFGGLVEDTTYYVKSISAATSSFTVSASFISGAGLAGPVYNLSDATGSMTVNIQNGTGTTWSTPIVYHNGTKLIPGGTTVVTKTTSGTNTITTNSTSGFIVNNPITFSQTMFGNDIVPFTRYYIKSIVSGSKFTISATPGGSTLVLADATGSAKIITNDYAFGIQPNGFAARIIFATNTYTNATDYLAYSMFGETVPVQYGYTLPETQVFAGNGSTASYILDNYIGQENAQNAIVEINGVRVTSSRYNINFSTNTILFNSPPPASSVVTVTTFNDTSRQYLNTQFGITGSPGSAYTSLTVGTTTHVTGTFDQNTPTAQSYDQNTPSVISFDENYSWLTLSSGNTSSLTINGSIAFDAPTIGGVVAGQVYYVSQILNSTEFTISELVDGEIFQLTNATGSMTSKSNGLLVTPISTITNNITGPVAVTYSTATDGTTEVITCGDTAGFVVNQTVEFKGVTFGGIQVNGTVYFIDSILSATTFKIKNAAGVIVNLSTGTGNLQTIVGGTPAVRVVTTIKHNLTENILTRIDGTTGSVQLNNNSYYVHIIDDYTFDLYTQPYDPAFGAVNYPVTTIAAYTGGGYVWRAGTFRIYNTTATATTNDSSISTINSGIITGYTMTFGSVTGDPIRIGMVVTGSGILPNTTIIGGAGLSWTVDKYQNTSATTLTGTYHAYPITCASTSKLVVDTPVYFAVTGALNGTAILGGLVQATEYYIKEILSSTSFTVSATKGGDAYALTTATGIMTVAQWSQINVDRLWVTLNGTRVPSSKLKVNPVNELSILTQIVPGDEVIITSMITHGTPDQETYINFVDPTGEASVYRANTKTRTWLTHALYEQSTEIQVQDIGTVTNIVVQNTTAPNIVDNYYSIGMTVDKQTMAGTTVLNNRTGNYISSLYYKVVVEELSPVLKITPGAYISSGDSLTITTLEGNTILINGEQIKFSTVNFATNTLSGLQRGANGTGVQSVIAKYSEVYGLLSANKLPVAYYDQTWNSNVWNVTDGDPLQISDTVPAQFLHVDIT
jgi:hypothetical protein